MPIPRYMLRRLGMPGGLRLMSVAEPPEVVGLCPACSKAVLRKSFQGQKQVDGHYRNNTFYHFGCSPIEEDAWKRNRHQAEVPIPKGNLEPEEYRFWIGTQMLHNTYAECRCCRKTTYSKIERALHLKDDKMAVNGDRCSVRLIKAYVALLGSQICMVCKKQRFRHERWGVPICDQRQCEIDWKFSGTKWAALEYQLRSQVVKQDHSIKGGIIVTTKDGIEKEFSWCSECSMFKDAPGHHEKHLEGIRLGKIQIS